MYDRKWLSTVREAGYAKRYHTRHIHGANEVAFHAFNVAMLCMYLTNGFADRHLILAALYHDLSELSTGDVPAPVKWKNPDLKAVLLRIEEQFNRENNLVVPLSAEEKLILRWADLLDYMLFAYEQRRLGSRTLEPGFYETLAYMRDAKNVRPLMAGLGLLAEIEAEYKELS